MALLLESVLLSENIEIIKNISIPNVSFRKNFTVYIFKSRTNCYEFISENNGTIN